MSTTTTLPPPPTVFGAAFVTVVREAASWDRARWEEIRRAWGRYQTGIADAVGPDVLWQTTDRVYDTLDKAGLNGGESCHPELDPPSIQPWVTDLEDICEGLSVVAEAAVAHQFGLITEPDYALVTGWWRRQGLPLPGSGAYAADQATADQAAHALQSWRRHVEDWPAAAAGQPARPKTRSTFWRACEDVRQLLKDRVSGVPLAHDAVGFMAKLAVAALRYQPACEVVDPGHLDPEVQHTRAVVDLACIFIDKVIGVVDETVAVNAAALAVVALGYDPHRAVVLPEPSWSGWFPPGGPADSREVDVDY